MTMQSFLSNLNGVKKSGKGYMALCSAHDDSNPSLSISVVDDKILLNCFAGCHNDAIVRALGLQMKDLYISNGNAQSVSKSASSSEIVATYDYTDENDELLFQTVRLSPKGFRQRRPDGKGGWIWNLKGVRLVPYRLHDVLASPVVFIVEGEKDVETLRKQGETATCSPMGAGKWREEYNSYFRGKTVVINPDNDAPGRSHGQQVASNLFGTAKEVIVLELQGLDPKGDVSDFFNEGGTIDGIVDLIANAEGWKPENADVGSDTEQETTKIKPFPIPDEKCFYGLAGDFVRLVEPHTEASKMALLAQFLVYVGNVVGRTAYFQVEGDRHYTNLFCVLVGRTAQGRKGTSFGRVKQVFRGIDQHHESECLTSGLASGEGLLYHVRDKVEKVRKGKLEVSDVGVSDKRMLVVESEFAQVLRVQGREGNTLSSFIRSLWETGTAKSLTKNSPLRTTNAHVSIIGHVTAAELLATLTEIESANGYANRFLFFAVERARLLPFGSDISLTELAKIQDGIEDAIKFAGEMGRMNFSIDAAELWKPSYTRLETSRFGYFAKMTDRASPYVLRMACIYALLDKSNLIKKHHLEAALAVWKYAEDSARFIFGDRLANAKANKLLDALKDKDPDGLTRTEIRDLFQRNVPKPEIDRALRDLLDANLVRVEKQKVDRSKPKEVWFLTSTTYDINDQCT